jgi:hypothetical protein
MQSTWRRWQLAQRTKALRAIAIPGAEATSATERGAAGWFFVGCPVCYQHLRHNIGHTLQY